MILTSILFAVLGVIIGLVAGIYMYAKETEMEVSDVTQIDQEVL